MSHRPTRVLLIVLTILGLLMPRISAAVAYAVPGARTVVICTGDGLTTIHIQDDGTPVPVFEHSDHCVLSHAADTAVRVEPSPVAAPLPDRVARSTGSLVRASGYRAARPPPRGPPAI